MRYMIDLFAQLLTMISVNKNAVCFHFNIFSFSRSHSVLVEISNILPLSADTVHGLGKALRLAYRFCSPVASEKPSLEPPNQQNSSFERFNVLHEGGGRGGRELARQVYFKQYFTRHELKRNNFKSHFNLPWSKICTSRIYFGLFYASRKDTLPPSCFTMLIFSRIELRLAHKIQGRERWVRNLWSYSFNI